MSSFKLNDGHSIPWLAIGTGTAHYQSDATHVVAFALEAGIVHLDGAQMYHNEESIGAGVKQSGIPREKLFITTKLDGVPAGKTVIDTLRDSLVKLQTDYVDLFLIHAPWQHDNLVEIWKQMEEIKKLGLARSIGVSNHRIQELELILKHGSIPPAVNQIEYHPYTAKANDPLLEFAKKHNIVISSYGGLTPFVRVKDGPVTPVVQRIRERLEKTRGSPVTEAQVLLKWVSQRGVVIITTTSKAERVKEYLDVANVPDLTPEEVKEITEAGYQLHHRAFMGKIDSLPDKYE